MHRITLRLLLHGSLLQLLALRETVPFLLEYFQGMAMTATLLDALSDGLF